MKVSSEDGDLKYSNWVKTNIMLAKPRDLYLYAGRGTGKSADILASRSHDVIEELPGAMFVFTSDTYMNLMTNVLPTIMGGWEARCGFYEGLHFVVDQEPPEGWEKPYGGRTFSYKHTISTYNGCKFFLTSLDRPSANAGLSVVHVFGDEAKYMKESKLNKLFPTLRGDPAKFGHSPYFLGKTFVSDMANPLIGEDDWMLRMEANMNRVDIIKAIQVGLVVNDIRLELWQANEDEMSPRAIANIEKKLERWEDRWLKARWTDKGEGSTFFGMISSYANADILTGSYFDNLMKTLDFEEYKTAVMTMRKSLSKNERFYAKMDDRHFYTDGYDYTLIDKHKLGDKITDNSLMLRYCQHDEQLEAGLDVGNMCSLVIGQPRGLEEYRVLKNIFTIPPKWIRDMADQFIEYFKYHRRKVLMLYYDRSANNFKKVGEDTAGKIKQAIEKDRWGKATGWEVKLMSIGQGNILHTEEYDLMSVMMDEQDRRLPKLRIDQFNCKELKGSMESAPSKPGSGNEKVMKDKRSEHLPAHRLPMESTNMSDALKYLLCRKEWLDYARAVKAQDYEIKVY
ncbi:MAG TPA: hypothetical protein DCL77_14335 [Prolixibacteraceae bacterium]|jgi:hypothetical protein|nr:hypothetical protein [Prolixibacteraceae bacterium]